MAITRVLGDFNLVALDSVEDHPVIEWVGCANEVCVTRINCLAEVIMM